MNRFLVYSELFVLLAILALGLWLSPFPWVLQR